MTPAADLRHVAALLERLPDDIAHRHAAGLRCYLDHAHEGATLDGALGLTTPSGKEHWWHVEARERRDELIRELAQTTGAKPAEIVGMLHRYETSAWRFDQSRRATPIDYAGTKNQLLFMILKAANGRIPTSARQVGRILNNGHEQAAIRVSTNRRISPVTKERVDGEGAGPG